MSSNITINREACLQRIQDFVQQHQLQATTEEIAALLERELILLSKKKNKLNESDSALSEAKQNQRYIDLLREKFPDLAFDPTAGGNGEVTKAEENYLVWRSSHLLQWRETDQEAAWKEALGRGDNASYKRLEAEFFNLVFNQVRKFRGDSIPARMIFEETREILQEIRVALLRNLSKPGYIIGVKLSTYVATIAWNQLKKKSQKKIKFTDLHELQILTGQATEESNLIQKLEQSLFLLEPRDQIILVAKCLIDLKHKEISQLLVFENEDPGARENNSKQQLKRAKERWKERIGG